MEGSESLLRLRSELALCLGQQRYDLWVGPHISLQWAGTTLQVGCPTEFEMHGLRRRLHKALEACCRKIAGEAATVEYRVVPVETDEETSGQSHAIADTAEVATARHKKPDSKTRPGRSQPKVASIKKQRDSTFGTFVVGKSNELAFRTAKAIADQPGQFGPLLLFGPPGVGKSHLQHAIVQSLRQKPNRVHTIRITSEQFTTEFLDALNRRSLPSFRQRYRSIDTLLVDDIQFMAGKRATLEELLYTIDALHERGRQVVLTSDRCPGDLQKVSLELVSRISGGLSIPIEPPEYETRLGIVRQLASRRNLVFQDAICELLATQVSGSARQISGAINRIAAESLARGEAISIEMAKRTLAEFVQQNTPVVRLGDIQRAVCEVFGVEASSLRSDRKHHTVAEPRMLAMWLARKYTRAALGEISEFFGRRSHSTVISAQRRIDGLVSQGATISVADRPCQVDEAIRQVELKIRTA